MSYVTVEVELEHGRIRVKGADTLPENASGLLTITTPPTAPFPRPVGLAKGQLVVPADFNAPLPDNVRKTFDGQ